MEYIFPLKCTQNFYEDKEINQNNLKCLCIAVNHSNGTKTDNKSAIDLDMSLLMQAAICWAAEEKNVLFISPFKPTKLPCNVHGMKQPSSNIMKYIKLLYAKEQSELHGYLAGLHLQPLSEKPSAIIVHNLSHYCNTDSDGLNQMYLFGKYLSLIQESISYSIEVNCNKDDVISESCKGLALISWKFQGSIASVSELREMSNLNNYQYWEMNFKNKKSYSMQKSSSDNTEFVIKFSLDAVNPNVKMIHLEGVHLVQEEERAS